MERVGTRIRSATLGIVAWLLLGTCPFARALNPSLDVNQYAHTAWKIHDGFAKGLIFSIAQTPDGYLWLGTEFGLLRFDGLRADLWQPPADQHLPSSIITSLLAARDGTLWIGTRKGLASWKDGKLAQYPELAGQAIFKLLEDRERAIWAGTNGVPSGRLCAIQNGSVKCYGGDGGLGPTVLGLYEDSKGNLWAGVVTGVWRWTPGPPKFYPLPGQPNGIQGLAEDENGSLLVSQSGRVVRFVDEKTETAYTYPARVKQLEALRLLRDHSGGLWIGTSIRGLVHEHDGRVDMFGRSDGLTGDDVNALFEDREGNIWVATEGGLDRFRDFAVATFSVNQGLSNAEVTSPLAAKDGSVWVGTRGGLNTWKNGKFATYGNDGGRLNGHSPNSLFRDDRGRIWASTIEGLGYLEDDQFIPIKGVPAGYVGSIAEDSAGDLWIANQGAGLIQLSHESIVQQIPWAKLGHNDPSAALAADPLHGGLWLGFLNGGVTYFSDGQVRASYSTADGLGEGHVNDLRLDPDGTLWAATDGGLSRLKVGHVGTLTSKNGLPCDAVHWVMPDDDGSFWLKMACGLVRIARSDLDAWAAAVEKDKDTKRTIQVTVFDSFEGVRSTADTFGYAPLVSKSPEGKLWFANLDGVGVVDPRHVPFNRLPPPVHIEQITADRKTYQVASSASGSMPLPALTHDLQIDYTALSLVAPEKVMFRYKLEGFDKDWQDAGNRRQAFYTNLSPRRYRFRVMACNNSGVWNEAGDSLDFSIAPTYYQTRWFQLSCVAAFLALLWALYQLRLRRVAQQFNVRMDERVNERTRIARELHDTLLQSFQGALLYFQTGVSLLPNRPDNARAKQQLEDAIDRAAQAITQGRDAVQDLRSSAIETNDLAAALKTLAGELAANETNQSAPAVDVRVEGAPRDLHPILRDEVYRFAAEALRNAFRHAEAKHIEIEIHYDVQRLRMRIRDDGKGMDAKIVAERGRPGHYGLRGMWERAKAIGGSSELWSNVESGTEIELTIPANTAYAGTAQRRPWFSRKGNAVNS